MQSDLRSTRESSQSGSGETPSASEPYEVVPGRPETGLVILCDHADNAFPAGYGTLGLPASELQRHIAYDIGAAGVTRAMATALGATAVLTRYSRLLIDPNRGADDPTLIMRLSDGAIVPGNAQVDEAETARRIARYYEPYHQAIDGVLQRVLAAGKVPVVLSIHSFTEAWKGVARPWHASVLWACDPRLPLPLLDELRRDRALLIGENQPYSGSLEGDCVWQHATVRGFAHALIEVRQDLIASPAGQVEWARRLTSAVEQVLADGAIRARLGKVEFYCEEKKRSPLGSGRPGAHKLRQAGHGAGHVNPARLPATTEVNT